MNQIYNFFWKLTALAVALAVAGTLLASQFQLALPTMFYPLVAFYYFISAIAFFVNMKGMQKESEIAVWYYMSSVMIKFLLAAMSVVVLTKYFAEQRKAIVYTSFVLYPLFEALVMTDIYKKLKNQKTKSS